MDRVIDWLNSDRLKRLQAMLSIVAAGVLTAYPHDSLPFKLATIYGVLTGGHAMLSTGVDRKPEDKP